MDILKETDKDTANPENVILFYSGWSVNAAQEYNNATGYSYKLFTESITGDDTNSKNALMIQVAKAIYEPQSTGFLNEKGQQVNSGLVEITKLIGQNGS